MRVFRSIEGRLLERGQDLGGDVYLAVLDDVLAGFGDGHGFLAESYGEVTGDAGVELAHVDLVCLMTDRDKQSFALVTV
jgi:hypothetical protein